MSGAWRAAGGGAAIWSGHPYHVLLLAGILRIGIGLLIMGRR